MDKEHTKEIRKLQQEIKQLRIHGRIFPFEYKDKIFDLQMSFYPEGEEPKKIQNIKCSLCNLPNLKLRACTFCGEAACEVCCRSHRAYPAQIVIGDDVAVDGRLCRLCDRKFMMYVFQESQVEKVIEKKEDIKGLISVY